METSTLVLKTETPLEGCALCGGAEGLQALEEHEAQLLADGAELAVPLRAQLLHLAHNKPLPTGPVCIACARRAVDAYSFSAALGQTQPLSDKIRALRRRLQQLTEKIDVFIVVGANANQEGGYSSQDIIMVERAALAAAAADELQLERAHNARGDQVYQCSLCPYSFQRLSEFRSHNATHSQEPGGADGAGGAGAASSAVAAVAAVAAARHSCWQCGVQCDTRAALVAHAKGHYAHTAAAAAGSQCGQAGAQSLRQRAARAFVCGHADCARRYASRAALLDHARAAHAAPPAPQQQQQQQQQQPVPCRHCYRTFGSVAAMKRHARVHRGEEGVVEEEEVGEGEEGVEYLEMEALEEGEGEDEVELKPQI